MLKMEADKDTDDISVSYEGDFVAIATECAAANIVLARSLIRDRINAENVAGLFDYVANYVAMLVDNTLTEDGEK